MYSKNAYKKLTKIRKINTAIFQDVLKNCMQKTHKESEKLISQYFTQMYSKTLRILNLRSVLKQERG